MLFNQGVYLKSSQTGRCMLGATGPLDALKRTAGAAEGVEPLFKGLAEETGSESEQEAR